MTGATVGAPRPAPEWVVHAVPGRVRVRVPDRYLGDGAAMAARLRATPDVVDVRWSPPNRSLVTRFAPDVSFEEVVQRMPETASERDVKGRDRHDGGRWWRQLLPPALALGAGVLGVFPVSNAVIAACGAPIGRRAVRALARRQLSIDVLDAAAVTLLLGTGDVLAAGVSVGLIESGERLRRQASGRARTVIRRWMGSDERGVRVVRQGTEPRIPMEEVTVGDHAVVYAGEAVPVDGRIVEGAGSVDNRTWTGEPYPVVVGPGDDLLAGATVVDGRLVVEISATGEQTRAGRLAAAIEEALAANTPTTDMARRIANRFVAPVLIGSAAAYLLTSDVRRVISMLIVDFGTGVRIGVPTSFLTAMVAGARNQMLFKNGRAIETMATVDAVIFDKTGTLTRGRPSVVGLDAAEGFEAAQIARLAAAAEGHLPHPMARAIRRYARAQHLELPTPSQVRVSLGGGVEADIEDHLVHVGAAGYLQSVGVAVPEAVTADVSVALVAIDRRFAGRVRLRDGVRAEARAVIDELREQGVSSLWLATGDRNTVARSVAQSLGLDGVQGRMLPEDKVELVRRLHGEGRTVAVVGDGINDAAAMAEADLGIAVARGADLARESAEVVLGREDLTLLVDALALARFTMRVVRQDIALVAVPNAAALAAATMGALPPLTATLVNNGSTLLVGANSLRPLRYRPAASNGSPAG